ncbi:hypothetical protein MMC08_000975 [Hypocenomyce scalaris]|nr:hypothetical protein [Hypocenomyce scalaris]
MLPKDNIGQAHRARELEDDEVKLLTICEDVEQALYKYVIYRELFHHGTDKALDPSLPVKPPSPAVGQRWMATIGASPSYSP